jgi:prolipoprotein diacylglyceryltransferase
MYMYWRTRARYCEGLIFGLFFTAIFGARFLIEFIKEDQEAFEATMSLNMGQWLSIPFVLGGIYLAIRAMKLPEKIYKNK